MTYLGAFALVRVGDADGSIDQKFSAVESGLYSDLHGDQRQSQSHSCGECVWE